jgi:hypothetical protein
MPRRLSQDDACRPAFLQLMDGDNYATSETPAQALTQPRSSCCCEQKIGKNHHNSHLPDQLPTPENTQSRSSCHQGLHDNYFHINLDEPPSIEEVCARIRAFEYDLQETVY